MFVFISFLGFEATAIFGEEDRVIGQPDDGALAERPADGAPQGSL